MKASVTIFLALTIVFIATFTLMYIFDSLNKFAESCKVGKGPKEICSQFSGFTLSVLLVLLIIGGFVLIISSVFFILLR